MFPEDGLLRFDISPLTRTSIRFSSSASRCFMYLVISVTVNMPSSFNPPFPLSGSHSSPHSASHSALLSPSSCRKSINVRLCFVLSRTSLPSLTFFDFDHIFSLTHILLRSNLLSEIYKISSPPSSVLSPSGLIISSLS